MRPAISPVIRSCTDLEPRSTLERSRSSECREEGCNGNNESIYRKLLGEGILNGDNEPDCKKMRRLRHGCWVWGPFAKGLACGHRDATDGDHESILLLVSFEVAQRTRTRDSSSTCDEQSTADALASRFIVDR